MVRERGYLRTIVEQLSHCVKDLIDLNRTLRVSQKLFLLAETSSERKLLVLRMRGNLAKLFRNNFRTASPEY